MSKRSFLFLAAIVWGILTPVSGADTLQARVLMEKANTSPKREIALKFLEQAAAIWKTTDRRQYAETQLQAALLFDNFEDREEAIRRAETLVRELETGSFPFKATLATVYHKYAVLAHKAGQLDKAAGIYQKALDIRKKVLGEKHLDTARTAFNLGVVYRAMGRYDAAITNLQFSAGIRENLGEWEQTGTSWFDIGRLHEAKGDFEAAVNSYNRALSYFGKTPLNDDHYWNTGRTHLSLGNISDRTEQPDEAIGQYRTAERFFSRMSENAEFLSLCNQNLGNVYDSRADWPQALASYQKALEQAKKAEDPLRTAKIESNLGFTLTRQGRLAEAAQILQRSLSDFKSLLKEPFHPEYAKPLVNLGDVDTARQDYRAAIRHYHAALQQVIPSLRRSDWEKDPQLTDTTLVLGEPYYTLAYLNAKAKGWQLLGEKEKNKDHHRHAVALYRQAVSYQDKLLREMIADQSRLVWIGQARAMFEGALRSCYALNDPETAFYFMEKSRAVLLLDALLANKARFLIPDSLSRKEMELKAILADAQQAFASAPSDIDLRQETLDAQIRLNEFLKKLSNLYPQYHNARYNVSVISLEAAREQLLSEGKAMILYFYGTAELFILRLPHSGAATLVAAPIEAGLKSGLNAYLEQFSPANRWNMRPDVFAGVASTLFDKIYRPVFYPEDRQVVIIPDGVLGYIPFDALLTAPARQTNWKSLDYLARKQVLQQAFSASVLASQTLIKTPRRPNYLLAPGFSGGEQGQAPLPYDGLEISGNGQMKIYSGREAAGRLLRGWQKGGGVLHFFTHAEAGDQPRIFFIDTTLQLPELYATPLPFDLVILSACETNIGQLVQGEGVMSLTRGFAYAGAASLMASLWQVKPQASADILNRFYRLLDENNTRAGALRQAKLEYLDAAPEIRAMPSYWAGLLMNGKDGRIELGQNRTWLFVVTGVFGLGLLIGFLRFGSGKKALPLVLAILTLAAAGCKREPAEIKLEWAEIQGPAGDSTVFPSLFQQKGSMLWQTWLYEPDTLSRLMCAGYDGQRWTAPVQVAAAPDWFVNWADFPSVFARNDRFVATYVLPMNGIASYSYDIGLYLSKDGGKNWTGPVIPHSDHTQTEHGFVSLFAWPGDRVGAVWLDGRNYAVESGSPHHGEADMTLRFAAVDPDGNLSDEAELDGRICSCCQTDAAVLADGSVAVVYRDRSPAEIRDISCVKWKEGRWSEPRRVHNDNWQIAGCPVNGPAIDGLENNLAVAWFTAPENEAGVYLAWSENGSESFGAPVKIDQGKPVGRVDVKLFKKDMALVSWVESETENTAALRLKVIDLSGATLADERISDYDGSRNSGFPRLATDGQRFYLAWTQTGEVNKVRMIEGMLEN